MIKSKTKTTRKVNKTPSKATPAANVPKNNKRKRDLFDTELIKNIPDQEELIENISGPIKRKRLRAEQQSLKNEKEQDVEEKDIEHQEQQIKQQDDDDEEDSGKEQELQDYEDENDPDKLLGLHPFSGTSYKHTPVSSKTSDFFADYMKGYINEEILNPAGYKQSVSKYMKDYDLRVNKEEKVMEKLRNVADDEGWIKVFPKKGKKFASPLTLTDVLNINSQIVETERDKTRSDYERMVPFYRHQKDEARKEELEFIQKKFEQDKKKILDMKANRSFE